MEAVWRLVSQSGDGDPYGDPSLNDHDLNGGMDRFETCSNAASEGACSCVTFTDAAAGDEVMLPKENNARIFYGQPRRPIWFPDSADDQDEHHVAQTWANGYNSRHENGNTGWAFFNGGARAKNEDKQKYFDKVMKRSPAIILGVAECDAATDEMLCMKGEPAVAPSGSAAGIEAALARASHEYVTIRGDEPSSLLLGVRKNQCRGLKLKEFQIKDEGTYRNGTSKKKLQATTRTLIAEVTTKENVGFIGYKHTVMVVHLHFTVAKGAQGKKQNKKDFIEWFNQKIIEYNVKVVMGDFNMAFWEVTGWVRDKHPNKTIDLAAWYGWKSFDGIPCSDSCGIWILDTPGLYTLVKDVTCIHEDDDTDETSLLIQGNERFQKAMKEDIGGWARFSRNGGPGQPLSCYQPATNHPTEREWNGEKYVPVRIPPLTQIIESLTLSPESEAWTSHHTHRGKTKTGIKECFRVKQTPLHYEGFCSTAFGTQGGSHYPLCVMTKNNSCRPPQKHVTRHKANDNKLRERGLMHEWKPVVHKDQVQDTVVAENHPDQRARAQWYQDKVQDTAVAEHHTDQRGKAPWYHTNHTGNNNWGRDGWYGKRDDAWDNWHQNGWKTHGYHESAKVKEEKENRGWGSWGNDSNKDTDRWEPKKIETPSTARRSPQARPELPPQPAESPVPSPQLEPPAVAVEPSAVELLAVEPLPLPMLHVPVSCQSSFWSWTPEGKWRHTESFWTSDGQSGSHSVDYPALHAGTMLFPDLGTETAVQSYNPVDKAAVTM
jgi:hypothetical protein